MPDKSYFLTFSRCDEPFFSYIWFVPTNERGCDCNELAQMKIPKSEQIIIKEWWIHWKLRTKATTFQFHRLGSNCNLLLWWELLSRFSHIINSQLFSPKFSENQTIFVCSMHRARDTKPHYRNPVSRVVNDVSAQYNVLPKIFAQSVENS